MIIIKGLGLDIVAFSVSRLQIIFNRYLLYISESSTHSIPSENICIPQSIFIMIAWHQIRIADCSVAHSLVLYVLSIESLWQLHKVIAD